MIIPLSLLFTHMAGMKSLTPVQTVTVGTPGRFDYMNYDSKYDRVYASHTAQNALDVYSVKTGKLDELKTGKVNGVMAYGKYLLAGGGGHIVVELNRKTLKTLVTRNLTGPGDDIEVSPSTNEVFVCHDDGTEIWSFTLKGLKLTGSTTISGAPEYLLYSKKTGMLYDNIKPTDQVQVIDPTMKRVVATWSTGSVKSPHGLALDDNLGVVVTVGGMGQAIEFNLMTGKPIATIGVKDGVDQAAYDPKLHLVYCAAKGFITVLKVSKTGLTKVGDYPDHVGAHTICVDPKTHDVWICYGDDSNAYLQRFSWK